MHQQPRYYSSPAPSTHQPLSGIQQLAGAPTQIEVSENTIRDVWASNLEEEFALIRRVLEDYPYIAMDTEFPGVVARPIGSFRSSTDYQYQTLRCNVDLLKIIQLGFTFADARGQYPPGVCTWQFNFRFNLNEDMYAQDSIDLLTRSGIDFKRLGENGIDVSHFGELLMSSGIVLANNVKWVTFHSGYDFGYLLKILTCKPLPAEEGEFFELITTFFPCIYDLKFLMKSCKSLRGGLNDLAEDLEVLRVGPQHQAGSDALLTGATFFKMMHLFFEDDLDDQKFAGVLYGLGGHASSTGAASFATPSIGNLMSVPTANSPNGNSQEADS